MDRLLTFLKRMRERTRRQDVDAVRTVFRKEGLEALRDRRTVLVAIFLPVVMTPIVTLGIPFLAQRQQEQVQHAPAKVAIVGGAYAPGLVAFGVDRHLITPLAVGRPEEGLKRREVDAVLNIPATFATRLSEGNASVEVTYDESVAASRLARQRLQELIAAYSGQLTENRLRARGLQVRDLAPIGMMVRDVADEQRRGRALLAGFLPFIISLWAVLGGQNVALDVAVGEKERQTLDALLVVPSPRWTLAVGKLLAVAAASLFAVMVVLCTTLVSLRIGASWLRELQRASIAISLGSALGLIIVAAALVFFLGAVELVLSFFARGLREAQQYFTPLYLFLVLPAMVAPFLEGWDASAWTYVVPALNAAFAFRGLLLGTLKWSAFTLTVLSLIAYGAVSLGVLVRLIQREAVVARS